MTNQMRKWHKNIKSIPEDCKVKICKKCKREFTKDMCGMDICENCMKRS